MQLDLYGNLDIAPRMSTIVVVTHKNESTKNVKNSKNMTTWCLSTDDQKILDLASTTDQKTMRMSISMISTWDRRSWYCHTTVWFLFNLRQQEIQNCHFCVEKCSDVGTLIVSCWFFSIAEVGRPFPLSKGRNG